MQIHGFQKLTLTDFPGRMASILFTGGCNFRCPYCHNGELVLRPDDFPCYTDEEIFGFLEKRRGMLDGVVISGGEPTLQKDLPEYAAKIKALGYLVKLDSNGTRPEVIRHLVEHGLVDYVAMDIKNDLEHYGETIGRPGYDTSKVAESVEYLLSGAVDYEFRTTVTLETHSEKNFLAIADLIKGTGRYYLQNFVPNENTIEKVSHSVPPELLKSYITLLRNRGIPAEIRNE